MIINLLKFILIGLCFLLLMNLFIPKIIDFFAKRRENKFLSEILKSDPIMKQLIENMEQKIGKKIKFGTHYLLMVFNDYRSCPWIIEKSGKILIPLDENKNILPRNKDHQIYTFAHELVHLQEKDFKKIEKNCGYKLMSCMFEELKADLHTIELLKEVNIEIGKQIFKNQKQVFWSEHLETKVDIQCEKCHQIIKQKECPELQKILEYLNRIALEANIKLIANPVSSKKNGVIFSVILKTAQPVGY